MTTPASRESGAVAPPVDVIAALTGIAPGDALDQARDRRPESRQHAQGSFEALFVPVDASQVSLPERAAVALFVARLHREPEAVAFYGALLRETGDGAGLEPLIVAEAERAAGSGPYGSFRAENAPESVAGPEYAVESVEAAYALGDRLAAALEHAHMLVLHPRDADRERLGRLLDAGWSSTGIVTLSQLVSFLAFQLRVAHGLRELRESIGGAAAADSDALASLPAHVAVAARERAGATAERDPAIATESLPPAPRVDEPQRFTQDVLGWKPWIEPLPVAEFTEAHYEALVQRDRVHMPYFRLLARDPEALRERTLTDLDIFFNTDAGLPRAERELAAAAASRLNGCVFCASVHSRFATEQGADRGEVQRLLDEGVGARISARIDAIVDATVALTATPPRFGQQEIAALRAVGLGELELLDAIQAGAFFNWANRLMLSIGEPSV
ncbi:alkylhydroperoxidase domain protein [Leucobacter chromiiresistens]|uniref:CMD domain protein, Avi_7170 family/alkylhydroperoxidase domain protein, Avi_7169 family n=2 Tax=Leucobacter chromiiresistens TaxID=1079994 RepID=A0A1H0XWI5_9MICO|nr:alkylhydroperoxidase domain protein [Leucobacter chromiiresistens]SDQ07240.1 CMD domain protein, Avi_7170 family/alkylhydroperoxidase domain protein, Avi_7169 family [Leucobacter chromiiresistens]